MACSSGIAIRTVISAVVGDWEVGGGGFVACFKSDIGEGLRGFDISESEVGLKEISITVHYVIKSKVHQTKE